MNRTTSDERGIERQTTHSAVSLSITVAYICIILPAAAWAQGRIDIQPQRNARFQDVQFAWGGSVTVTGSRATVGRCRVLFEYRTVNQGRPTTTAYVNRYVVDGNLVVGSREVPAGSRGGESFTEQLDLPAGEHRFELLLDANNAIAESDEVNNRREVRYTLSCAVPPIDVTAALPLRIAGRDWQWNDSRRLQLRSSQATGKRDGYCRFPISFLILEKSGQAVTTPFSVVIVENRRDGMPAQTVQGIASGIPVNISGGVWLRCCKRSEPRFAVLHIDPPPSHQLNDSDRSNNRFELSYEITGSCQ